ncbi:hypothetical protein J8J42_12740 [Chryseobacterium sp. cx-311]|uniref:hypothetical protein n=1 Tax=Marnyiella aurantia TaxID=2758037 RepID=UPI001AE4F3D9|nr:hypothetical protein [Marnyiella aurantia]MBP0613906.1 hypothetical protein [Marnyiella aurantia]
MKKIFNTNSYIYLSIFRILISIHIFKKYLIYFINRDILLSKTFIDPISQDKLLVILGVNQTFIHQNISVLLNIILLLCILFACGVFKYIIPIFLFIAIELFQRSYIYIPNGGDNLLKFVLLYLIFTNCYRFFTLKKYTKHKEGTGIGYFVNQVAVLLIKAHLCLIYMTSAIFKLNSKVWFTGIATYYTLQLERFQGTDFNIALSKNGYFVTAATYATLLWELVFPFFAWTKVSKFYVFGSGIMIHLGIYLLMMIHDFEILFIMCYGFFISDEEWTKGYRLLGIYAYYFKRRIYKISDLKANKSNLLL